MNPNVDPKPAALTRLRIIWTALLLAPFLLFGILIIGMAPKTPTVPSTDPALVNLLHYISIAMAAVLLPMGYFIRLQTYKKHWVMNAVTPRGYVMGNMILLAICEAIAMFTIIATYLAGVLMPFILPAVVASMTHIINWPTGGPMEPAEMDLRGR